MNATLHKFGYPANLLREYDCWAVLLRPQQVTLGSLVLGAKSSATAFSDLEAPAFSELAVVIASIEKALSRFRPYQKLNYLMLMMVDPHVHMHVIPRYNEPQHFEDNAYVDHGWPGLPDLKSAAALSSHTFKDLLTHLKPLFAEGA